jgi:D-alanyl-D-alanine carboxypeptidase
MSRFYVITFFALIFVLSLHPKGAGAAPFDPNYLLSDAEMQDWQSMNRADIQAFLRDRGGSISGMKLPDLNNTPRTVADIIYRAAREHQINPKYLLVKLQKEQSLVTQTNPTQKQLDGATGYGITDGCGWSCATYLKNKGFGKQVDSAAGIMRWYYQQASSQPWIKKPGTVYSIDNTQIKPANQATAFLYTYTPHIQGNKNFWTLWQTWFDQVYPDGSLVKVADDATVYLLRDGKKQPFASFAALSTRFDPSRILVVQTSDLQGFPDGPSISLPNYAILKRGLTYYLLDDDRLRAFASQDIVRQFGYHPDEIIDVASADLAGMKHGRAITSAELPLLGRLVRFIEDGELYYIDSGLIHPLFDAHIAKTNFPHLAIEKISAASIEQPVIGDPVLFKDGTLIQARGSSKVYVIANQKKRHIASEAVFTQLGYTWEHIIIVSKAAVHMHDTGEPLYLRSQPDKAAVVSTPEDTLPNKSDVSNPSIEELMIRVSDADTVYIGEKFDTPIDTYLAMEVESGDILAGKNIDTVRPMASMAKVVTAHQLLLSGLKLSTVSTYDPTDHKATYHRFRVAAGEKIYNKHLLDSFLVSSLNTPGRVLVDAVEEQESNFVAQLNAYAKEVGATQTTFVDVTGEHIDTVATARDYVSLYRRATKDRDVKSYLGKKSYTYNEFKDLDDKPTHFDTHSNELTQRSDLAYEIITSKTGYLYEAGACLIMHVRRSSDQKEFIILTMANPDYSDRFSQPARFAEWIIDTF